MLISVYDLAAMASSGLDQAGQIHPCGLEGGPGFGQVLGAEAEPGAADVPLGIHLALVLAVGEPVSVPDQIEAT